MQPKDFREPAEQGVEQNIGGWIRDPQPGHLSVLNQLSEPGIVNMAAKIAGFDVGVPKAGNQNQRRNREQPYPAIRDERASRRQDAGFRRDFDR